MNKFKIILASFISFRSMLHFVLVAGVAFGAGHNTMTRQDDNPGNYSTYKCCCGYQCRMSPQGEGVSCITFLGAAGLIATSSLTGNFHIGTCLGATTGVACSTCCHFLSGDCAVEEVPEEVKVITPVVPNPPQSQASRLRAVASTAEGNPAPQILGVTSGSTAQVPEQIVMG